MACCKRGIDRAPSRVRMTNVPHGHVSSVNGTYTSGLGRRVLARLMNVAHDADHHARKRLTEVGARLRRTTHRDSSANRILVQANTASPSPR